MTSNPLVVTLGGITFNNNVPQGGVLWRLNKLDGWDSPSARHEVLEPTGRHGGVLAYHLDGPRTIVLTGSMRSTTPSAGQDVVWTAHTSLMANATAATVLLTVNEPVPKRILCVPGPTQPKMSPPRAGWSDFQVVMQAMKPYKESTNLNSVTIQPGATTLFTTYGNVSAYAQVAFTGALSLAWDGYTMTTQLMPSVTLDSWDKTVYASGVRLLKSVDPGSTWLTLKPGTTSVKNNGTTAVTVMYRETWR